MIDEINSVERMSRDIAKAAGILSDREVRYLVDSYYMMQNDRKRANNQLRAMQEIAEPNSVVRWLAEQSEILEQQLKRALDKYTQDHIMGSWMRGIYGIGPVISAGILAHVDIEKAPTAGHIWSFAGLVPGVKWEKGQKRPWNARLKTVFWHAGQSFMKFSNVPECYYGQLYKERKAFEIARNESGGNKEAAALVISKYNKTTDAYKHLLEGKLPPAQIDARARRWAVKLFISHLQNEWYRRHFKQEPPRPYAIEFLGHAHMIEPQMM